VSSLPSPIDRILTCLAVSFTGAIYIIVFALIGLTTVHPLGPILLSSFALSTNAITFIASIPILVGNDALLGTAFGVWKSFVSPGTVISNMVGLSRRRIATVSFWR